jgi:hypothetical protein
MTKMAAAAMTSLEAVTVVQDVRSRVVLGVKMIGEEATALAIGDAMIVIGSDATLFAGVLEAVGVAAAASPLTRRRRSCRGRRLRLRKTMTTWKVFSALHAVTP